MLDIELSLTQLAATDNMVFTQGPAAHLRCGAGLDPIIQSNPVQYIVRFVQGGVPKTFRQTQVVSLATENDIHRWHETANRSLEILARRLGNLESPEPDAQGLNMLHLAYAGLGYAYVAAGDFTGGHVAFSRAVHAHAALYDLIDADPRARLD